MEERTGVKPGRSCWVVRHFYRDEFQTLCSKIEHICENPESAMWIVAQGNNRIDPADEEMYEEWQRERYEVQERTMWQ